MTAGAERWSRLPCSLHPQRIGPTPHVTGLESEHGDIGSPRQGIIHQRSADELARGRIVHCILHQGLANALRSAPVHLPGKKQRIESGAKIIHNDVLQNLSAAPVSGSISISAT